MVRLSCIATLFFLGGCALPLHYSLSDRPPFKVLVGRTLVTTCVSYLAREEIHPPPEPAPSSNHRYFLTDRPDWPAPKFLLPASTQLRIRAVYHVFYPPLPSYFDTSSYNSISAVISSGRWAGVKVWTFWGAKADEIPDFLLMR